MGFLGSRKNNKINSIERNSSFGSKIVSIVQAVAEGSLILDGLSANVAQNTINSGFCSESLLNAIRECILSNNALNRTPANSRDEAIAQAFVNTCKDICKGRRLALGILGFNNKFSSDVYMECNQVYDSIDCQYGKETNELGEIDKTLGNDCIVITEEVRNKFREEVDKRDVLIGRIIKCSWSRMPSTKKNMDRPIESIKSFLDEEVNS